MNKNFMFSLVLSFCPLIAFATDDKETYQDYIKLWGANPHTEMFYEKMKDETLAVDDIRLVLKAGVFGTSKVTLHGLVKVSEGKTTSQSGYSTNFPGKDFIIVYQSRTLGPREEISSDATLEFLEKQEIDATYSTYIYKLTSLNNVFQFTLSRQKIVKLSEDAKLHLNHLKKLKTVVDFRRPPSVNLNMLPQELDSEREKAEIIETFIARQREEASSSEAPENVKTRKPHSRQRSYSDAPTLPSKPSGYANASLSSSLTASPLISPNSSPGARRPSFAVVDVSSMYEKDEKKKQKSINKPTLAKTSRSTSVIDLKELVKKAKKDQKKREKEKNKKSGKE